MQQSVWLTETAWAHEADESGLAFNEALKAISAQQHRHAPTTRPIRGKPRE